MAQPGVRFTQVDLKERCCEHARSQAAWIVAHIVVQGRSKQRRGGGQEGRGRGRENDEQTNLNAAIIASPALVAITGGRDTPDVVTVAAAPVQNRAVEFTWDCGFGVWRDDGAREGTANGVASAGDLVEL